MRLTVHCTSQGFSYNIAHCFRYMRLARFPNYITLYHHRYVCYWNHIIAYASADDSNFKIPSKVKKLSVSHGLGCFVVSFVHAQHRQGCSDRYTHAQMLPSEMWCSSAVSFEIFFELFFLRIDRKLQKKKNQILFEKFNFNLDLNHIIYVILRLYIKYNS